MTDLHILTDMLKRSNIDFELDNEDEYRPNEIYVTVHRGYQGFVSTFVFNLDGQLMDLGAWE